jgi:hypothetical protein
MGGSGDKVEETPQQRAMTEMAINKMRDYEQRWLPVQRQFAQRTMEMGKKDSATRRQAAGAAAAETTARFQQARGGVEASLAQSGAGLGSGRAKAALIGLGDDEATSRGLGMAGADQAVDDAYTQTLGALMSIGRGEQAQVEDAMGRQATMSARTAQADASQAAANRAGNAELLSTVGGYGMAAAMNKGPNIPKGFTRQGANIYGLGNQSDAFRPDPQAGY